MGTQSTWGVKGRQTFKTHLKHRSQISRAKNIKMSGSRVPVTMRDFFFDDPFFKNSWEDFDKVRDAMFTESRDMWKKFDDDFRNMACMSNNIMLEHSGSGNQPESITNNNENRSLMRQDSKSRWENGWMFPRRWMLPALNTDFPSNMDIFKDKDNEVIRVKEDETKMEVSLDTSQYRPDELKVMVNDGVLTVEGKHEEKAEDGSKMVSRMFSRKYTLPPAAKSEEVVSNLSSDGVLVITAPKKNLAIK